MRVVDPVINKALIPTPLWLREHCGREGRKDVSRGRQDEGLDSVQPLDAMEPWP